MLDNRQPSDTVFGAVVHVRAKGLETLAKSVNKRRRAGSQHYLTPAWRDRALIPRGGQAGVGY